MKSNTKTQLIEYIDEHGPSKPKDLSIALEITPQALHRHLKTLVENGKLIKRGQAPVVFYEVLLDEDTEEIQFPELKKSLNAFIDERYFYVSPSGKILHGVKGFQAWVDATDQVNAYLPLAEAYAKQRTLLDAKFKDDCIVSTDKISATFETNHLTELIYQEFWKIPQFGRTRLGHLVSLGKSGQNLNAIKELANNGKSLLESYIELNEIDAIAFAPHSVPRKLVFLKTYSELLSLNIPVIKFGKALTDGVAVAQKTLTKLPERIKNARETIFVMDHEVNFKTVLIIDDALGSGATINEMAGKLKKKRVEKVFGFAIVGSLKGFEVIPEV